MGGYALPSADAERSVVEARDGEVIDVLYRTYAAALRDLCRAKTGDTWTAEDACHETVLRAARAWPRFRKTQPLWPWLSTIASNVCHDLDRRQRHLVLVPHTPDSHQPSFEDEVAARVDGRMLSSALARLEPTEQELLYQHDVIGVPFDKLAGALGATPSAVRMRAKRARDRVRRHLEERGDARRLLGLPALLPWFTDHVRAVLGRVRLWVRRQPPGTTPAVDSLASAATSTWAPAVAHMAAAVAVSLGTLPVGAPAPAVVPPADAYAIPMHGARPGVATTPVADPRRSPRATPPRQAHEGPARGAPSSGHEEVSAPSAGPVSPALIEHEQEGDGTTKGPRVEPPAPPPRDIEAPKAPDEPDEVAEVDGGDVDERTHEDDGTTSYDVTIVEAEVKHDADEDGRNEVNTSIDVTMWCPPDANPAKAAACDAADDLEDPQSEGEPTNDDEDASEPPPAEVVDPTPFD